MLGIVSPVRFGFFLLALTGMSLAGCNKQHEPEGTIGNAKSTSVATDREIMGTITKMKALELVQQEFQKKTRETYEDYNVVVKDDPTGEEWVISFEKKYSPSMPRPTGGGFWATVDKNTGKVFFRAGD